LWIQNRASKNKENSILMPFSFFISINSSWAISSIWSTLSAQGDLTRGKSLICGKYLRVLLSNWVNAVLFMIVSFHSSLCHCYSLLETISQNWKHVRLLSFELWQPQIHLRFKIFNFAIQIYDVWIVIVVN
jgi:hypothetical protein